MLIFLRLDLGFEGVCIWLGISYEDELGSWKLGARGFEEAVVSEDFIIWLLKIATQIKAVEIDWVQLTIDKPQLCLRTLLIMQELFKRLHRILKRLVFGLLHSPRQFNIFYTKLTFITILFFVFLN